VTSGCFSSWISESWLADAVEEEVASGVEFVIVFILIGTVFEGDDSGIKVDLIFLLEVWEVLLLTERFFLLQIFLA